MKVLYKNLGTQALIFIFLFLSAASAQEQTFINDNDSIIEEGFNSIVSPEANSDNNSVIVSTSCLNIPVTLELKNANLNDGLKEIKNQTNINIIYSNNVTDINGISISVKDEPLRKVFDELFSGRDIGYYEIASGKIALAKLKRIDEKTGSIKGIVKDASTGEVLMGANVMLLEEAAGSATDTDGKYQIKNIKPGTYRIRVSFVGYENTERRVSVSAGKILNIDFEIQSSSFQIGGIEVVGSTDLLPKDVNTKTTITSGEIEHYQASSVKDVLDLVPGVQKSDNPGLGKESRVAVRGDDSDFLSSFGTSIMIDGSRVSGNANLKSLSNLSSQSNTGSAGVDLRTIPADNIESIEIITGLPSVRYGDATEGVINIKTRIGKQPNRFKFKNNPDTREANFGGGLALGQDGLCYNFNLAQSERDIRKDGDEYTRITGQTTYSSVLYNNLETNHKINGQMIYDEEAPKGDVYKINNYDRSFSLGYSSWGKTNFSGNTSFFEYNLNVNYKKLSIMKSKLIQSDLRILPNGDTVSSYIGKVETKGNEWGLGGRFEWNRIAFTGSLIHKILIGTDFQYDAAVGDGITFDTLYSYFGSESGKRPYSFNSIPGQFLTSFYAEDKITGKLGVAFSLMLGFRYEMYRPYKLNLKGLWGDGDLVNSHNGSFFNPRLNLMLYLSEINQLRFSAGITSKSPSMAVIFPPEDVFRWRNPIENKIMYLRYDTRVPDLKGFEETQLEIAYDHKLFGMLGTSFSAYYKKRDNETERQDIPVFAAALYNNQPKVFFVDEYQLSQNLGWTITKGIEFSVKTNKIEPLNMNFQVTGSYNYIDKSRRGYKYNSKPDASKGQLPNYNVPNVPADTIIGFLYSPEGRWDERFQLNYYVKYTLPPLGLWVTFRAEQLVKDNYRNYNLQPEDYNLLTPSGKELYNFQRAVKSKPVKWLLNLSISKSLFKGAEVSFYVNNFMDDPAIRRYYTSPTQIDEERRNPVLFYGLEFSCCVDELF